MGNPIKDMMDRAQRMDKARQRQIEAQKESIDRLLKARESEPRDAAIIIGLMEERVGLQRQILNLQAKIDEAVGIAEVAERDGNASHIVQHMKIVLTQAEEDD